MTVLFWPDIAQKASDVGLGGKFASERSCEDCVEEREPLAGRFGNGNANRPRANPPLSGWLCPPASQNAAPG